MTAVGPVGGILYMVQTFIIESKNMVEVTMVGGTGVGGMDGNFAQGYPLVAYRNS